MTPHNRKRHLQRGKAQVERCEYEKFGFRPKRWYELLPEPRPRSVPVRQANADQYPKESSRPLYAGTPPTLTAMYPISDTVAELKRLQNKARRFEREREEINTIAKSQRIEIRKLKKLLEESLALIPPNVRADKFYEEVDAALHKKEL